MLAGMPRARRAEQEHEHLAREVAQLGEIRHSHASSTAVLTVIKKSKALVLRRISITRILSVTVCQGPQNTTGSMAEGAERDDQFATIEEDVEKMINERIAKTLDGPDKGGWLAAKVPVWTGDVVESVLKELMGLQKVEIKHRLPRARAQPPSPPAAPPPPRVSGVQFLAPRHALSAWGTRGQRRNSTIYRPV
jgi:hypothetical protein